MNGAIDPTVNPTTGITPPPTETVTAFMESYFSPLQLEDLTALGMTITDFDNPLSKDQIGTADAGIPDSLNFTPKLATPTSTKAPDPATVDYYVLQSLISQISNEGPDYMRDQLEAAATTGKGSPSVLAMLASLKSYGVYYQGVVNAGKVPPVMNTDTWLSPMSGGLTKLANLTDTLATAAVKVQAEITNTPHVVNSMIGFLAAVSNDVMNYRNTLFAVQIGDSELTAKLSTLSMDNTDAQLNAEQAAVLAEQQAEQAAEARQAAIMGGVGGGLIGLAILAAIILAIVTLGTATPVSGAIIGGVVALSVGMAVAGANLAAQAAGAPSMGGMIQQAMEESMSQAAQLGVSSAIMALSVLVAIISLGTLGFMVGVAAGITAGVVASVASTMVTAMVDEFTSSVENALTQDYINGGMNAADAAAKAQQATQAIVWTMTALMMVASVSSFLPGIGRALMNAAKDLLGIPRLVGDFMTDATTGAVRAVGGRAASVAAGVGDVGEEAGASAAGGARAGGGAGGSAGGGSGEAEAAEAVGEEAATSASSAARAASSATRAASHTAVEISETATSQMNAITSTLKKIFVDIPIEYFNEIEATIDVASNAAQAAVSFSQYSSLKAQAQVALVEAEYQELVTTSDALQKMLDTTIQAILTNQTAASEGAASMTDMLNKIMQDLKQAVTAITSNSAANISYAASGSVAPTEPPPPDNSPPNKISQEEMAAIAAQTVVIPNTFAPSGTVAANQPGVAGKSNQVANPETNQKIATAQLLNALGTKMAEMFAALGLSDKFAKRLGRELSPALLKGLLAGGEKKPPSDDKQLIAKSPILQLIKSLMDDKPMTFKEGSTEEEELADQAAKEPGLTEFEGQLKNLINTKENITPVEFGRLVAELSQSIIKIGKGSGKDDKEKPGSAAIELLEHVLGKGGFEQFTMTLNLSSLDELSPVLKNLVDSEENPYEQYSLHTRA